MTITGAVATATMHYGPSCTYEVAGKARQPKPLPFRQDRRRRHPIKAKPARVDARTPVEIAQAACAGRCIGTAVKPLAAASTSGPIIPASWTVPAWYRDIGNSTVCASDTNSGTAATCSGGCVGARCPSGIGPVIHYQEIAVHRWGTYSPRLQQNTTLTGLSSDTDASDPIYWTPYNELGAFELITAPLPTPTCTTTLSSVTGKSRTPTPQLLKVGFTSCAGAATGQLVQNTMHPSWAWIYTSAGGGDWNMSQPQVLLTVPFGIDEPAEIDTWAVSDPVTVYSPTMLNVVQPDPLQSSYDDNGDNVMYGMNFGVFDPNGVGADDIFVGEYTGWQNVLFQRGVSQNGASIDGTYITQYVGTWTEGGLESSSLSANTDTYGGIAGVSDGFEVIGNYLGNDVIVASDMTGRNTSIARVYIEAGTTLHTAIDAIALAESGSGPFIWGPGHLDVAFGQLEYPATQAVATFLLTGPMTINGESTACSYTVAAPSVINCGISITPAHLDAAAGAAGFGGNAVLLGGGSITTFGF